MADPIFENPRLAAIYDPCGSPFNCAPLNSVVVSLLQPYQRGHSLLKP